MTAEPLAAPASKEAPGKAEQAYEAGRSARDADYAALEGRSRLVGTFRLALVAAALGLLVGIVWGRLPAATWGVLIGVVFAFVGLVVLHGRVEANKAVAAAGKRFHERGLARIRGTWQGEDVSTFEYGSDFAVANHPYAEDLDLFGKGSLFHRISQAQTRFGAAQLAFWLKTVTDAGAVRARQEAVRDLAGRVAFRERLVALGAQLGDEKPDPGPMLEWAEGKLRFEVTTAARVVARVMPVLTLLAIAFAGVLPRGTWVGMIAVQLALTLPFRAEVARVVAAVTARESGLARYGDMLMHLEGEPFDAPYTKEKRALLATGAASDAQATQATVEMRRLARIVSFAEARHNEVFKIFIAPLLLWDLQCAIALEGWRARAGGRVRGWLDVLGEVEALASLSTLAFEDEGATFPEIVLAPVFDAEALSHPLIAKSRRVGNDVSLPRPGYGLIVTGSNMSGKSTLLRALGITTALALAGGPVIAKRVRVGPVRLVTSMRIADSLERGVSHFFAELQRLKLALDMAASSGESSSSRPPVFFLLDEILHGTNARERLVGARAVIRNLLRVGAMGAVSTHDLAIGELEAEMPESVKNVHFEEQVHGGTMTFDFVLRPGVVQSSNALRLMRAVGIDVPEA